MRRVAILFQDRRTFLDFPKGDAELLVMDLAQENVYHNKPLSDLKLVEVDGYVVPEQLVTELLAAGLPPAGQGVDYSKLFEALKRLSTHTVEQRLFSGGFIAEARHGEQLLGGTCGYAGPELRTIADGFAALDRGVTFSTGGVEAAPANPNPPGPPSPPVPPARRVA